MRASDVKALQPPTQITQSDDPGVAYWMGGWESMRSAVLFMLEQDVPRPTWEFKPVVMSDSGGESQDASVS